jgi:hypothetical protein
MSFSFSMSAKSIITGLPAMDGSRPDRLYR